MPVGRYLENFEVRGLLDPRLRGDDKEGWWALGLKGGGAVSLSIVIPVWRSQDRDPVPLRTGKWTFARSEDYWIPACAGMTRRGGELWGTEVDGAVSLSIVIPVWRSQDRDPVPLGAGKWTFVRS